MINVSKKPVLYLVHWDCDECKVHMYPIYYILAANNYMHKCPVCNKEEILTYKYPYYSKSKDGDYYK